jgi:hypothetical protein
MGDRHRRAALAPHNFHASVELLGECRDDDRTQSGTCALSQSNWLNAVAGNHKSPARSAASWATTTRPAALIPNGLPYLY